MATILFDIFPAMGHYNASFLLAKQLSQKHKLIFACNSQYQKLVEQQGYQTYLIEESMVLPYYSTQLVKNHFELFWQHWLLHSRRKLIADEKGIIAGYNLLKKTVKPEIIILDSHHFRKIVIYDSFGVEVIRIQTMQSTLKSPFIPPICYSIIPKYTYWGSIHAGSLWILYKLSSRLKRFINKIQFSDQETESYLYRLAKQTKFSFHEKTDYQRYSPCGIDFKGYKEMIIPTTAFDFPKNNCKLYSLNAEINDDTIFDNYTPRYKNFVKSLKFEIKNKPFIIYCSLGTLGHNEKNRSISFLSKIKKVFSTLSRSSEKYICVISIGSGIDFNVLFPWPPNTYVFERTPQKHLLRYCNMMITHGGMNSISECIQYQVPMLVFPLSKNWDQPGNAARVVWHGLGIKGDMSQSTPKSIIK